MEIRQSARKHGIDDADIEHAWTQATRLVEYDNDGEDRPLVIAPTDTDECSSWWPYPPTSPPASFTLTGSVRSSMTI